MKELTVFTTVLVALFIWWAAVFHADAQGYYVDSYQQEYQQRQMRNQMEDIQNQQQQILQNQQQQQLYRDYPSLNPQLCNGQVC